MVHSIDEEEAARRANLADAAAACYGCGDVDDDARFLLLHQKKEACCLAD